MKKTLLLFTLISSLTSFSWETNLKTGFDFYRKSQSKKTSNYEKGWTL